MASGKQQRKFNCVDCSVPVWREFRHCYPCYVKARYPKKQTREERLARHRRWQQQVKDEVFTAYGGYQCNCCGETTRIFLVIDHINGGGNKERRALKTSGGAGQYWELRKKGFPPGFQVLCHNCNFAKSNGGCPHAKCF